ncbi:retrotransposon protein, putative, ty1-copia subclass [Tanacetum coccineum]
MLQDVKSYIKKCFAMKDLGKATYVLGIKIYRDRSRRLIGLCQSAYIENILKRFNMENSKRGSIPMQDKPKLTITQGALKSDEMTTQVVNNSVFRTFFKKEKLSGANFIDWYRSLCIVLSAKDKLTYLEHHLLAMYVLAAGQVLPPNVFTTHQTLGLRGSKKLKPGTLNMYVGNGHRVAVEIGIEQLPKTWFASMMSLDYFPRSFLGYALEFAARILNMVSTRKVEKTPYEVWHGQARKISVRTGHALDRMCLYVNAEEHELGDHNEPANYKAAFSDLDSDKWLGVMNVEMQSMKDNQVGDLVDLPPNDKIVGSNWLFKNKTDMDGNVHTYKAYLVAKSFAQTYGVDYEETFSPVTDIRSISILIAIVAFYDNAIWKMDVKIAFLNGHLFEEVYMVQLEGKAAYVLGIKIYRDRSRRLIGLCQSAYIENILKRFNMENSKRGIICTRPNVTFTQKITSRFQQNQGELHLTVVKNIMKYIRNTKDMFLVYGDVDDSMPQTRYVFVLNGGDVDWKSTTQSILAISSTKAEYIAAFVASKEAVDCWFVAKDGGIVVVERWYKGAFGSLDPMSHLVPRSPMKLLKSAPYILASTMYFLSFSALGLIKVVDNSFIVPWPPESTQSEFV